MMRVLFILDLAGNLVTEYHASEEALDDAIENWELGGNETFTDEFEAMKEHRQALKPLNRKDYYDRS